MNVGYIYILSNPMMPGLIKIGITSREVRQRAAELSSTTGVPAPFEVEYYCLTSSPEEVEVNVHKHFASHRAPGREFFAIALRNAIQVIDPLIRPVIPERFCKTPEEELHPSPPPPASKAIPPRPRTPRPDVPVDIYELRRWQERRYNSNRTV